MNEQIPTMAEHEAAIERICAARFICKHDKFPSPAELATERSSLFFELSKGMPSLDTISRATAQLYLRGKKVTVPAPAEPNA